MVVPEAGLEPARYFYRGILSPLCLPIPPLGHTIYRQNLSSASALYQQVYYTELL